jgi:hypothetical protein
VPFEEVCDVRRSNQNSTRRPSDRERRRERAQSAPANDHRETGAAPPLLVNRREAARLLGGISISTMLRLEQSGALRARTLTNARTAQRFYVYSEIVALAQRGVA